MIHRFYDPIDEPSMDKVDIRTLSLMSSPACNLQCEYCQMAQQKHGEENKIIWDNTVKALKNGSFLQNTINVLRKLKQPVHLVRRLEFWGQEPTLTLPIIAEHWDEWAYKMSGVRSVFFSTNGIGDPQNIIDFILAVEEKSNRSMQVDIQLSYDGPYGEEQVRGGDSNLIKNNFIDLQKQLNNYNFKNINEINIMLHGVFSTKLINFLDTMEKVDLYFKEYEEFFKDLTNVTNNGKVNIYPPVFMYQNCYSATTEDGVCLNNFVDRVNRIKSSQKYPLIFQYLLPEEDFGIQMLGNGAAELARYFREHNQYHSLGEYIDDYFVNPEHPQRRNVETCSTSMGDLKLMYDGSILVCQNSIYDTLINKDILDNSVENWGRYHFMTHGQYINPLTATEEEIDKYFLYIKHLREPSNFRFIYITTFNLMTILARTGQISPEYAYDLEKTKCHAFLMARTTCCYYNMQVMAGSVFVRQTGEIRQLCNGMIDRIQKYIDMMCVRKYFNLEDGGCR